MRQVEFQNAVEPWEQGWPSDFTNLTAFYPAGYGNGLSGVGCIGCTGDCGSCGMGAPRQRIVKPKQPKPPGNVPYTPPPLQPGASYIWVPGMTLGGLTPEAAGLGQSWGPGGYPTPYRPVPTLPSSYGSIFGGSGGYRARGMAGMGFAPGVDYQVEPFPWWLLAVAGVLLLSSKKGRK